MFSGGAITTNPLQIPSLFASDYETTARIGFVLFSIMLVVAILHENIQGMKGESDYAGLFIRIVLVVSLLVLYERFFVWIVHALRLLGDSIFSKEQYEETIQSIFHEIRDNKDMGFFSFQSLLRGMNTLTYHFALAVLSVLRWLQFILLATLYILGPIVIGAGVYHRAAQGLGFWVKSVIEVSSWQVLLAILLKVISTMNLTAIYFAQDSNSLSVFAANILFIVLFILVPLISRQVVSGAGSLGGVGSIALGAVTAFLAKHIKPGRR
ncbi:MAG TPA: hypothetical protein PLO78_05255 [Candidatus Omnitrophota bacterium]|nr:hypothetical protein [Candidatus Omnitrophota bacterium]